MPSNSPPPTNADDVTVRLLPCPFCGSEAEIERLGTPRQSTIYRCTSCGCSLETGEEWSHGRDWNRRIAHQSTGEMLKRGFNDGWLALAKAHSRAINPREMEEAWAEYSTALAIKGGE